MKPGTIFSPRKASDDSVRKPASARLRRVHASEQETRSIRSPFRGSAFDIEVSSPVAQGPNRLKSRDAHKVELKEDLKTEAVMYSPRAMRLESERRADDDDVTERMREHMSFQTEHERARPPPLFLGSADASENTPSVADASTADASPRSEKSLSSDTASPAKEKEFGSGSTAVTALIQDDMLYVAHVGDSRAVLSVNGKAEQITDDHRALRDDEAARIEAAGGFVLMGRVDGILAVSRGIGDEKYKKYVISEPEVSTRRLSAGDRFLIIASDGLWDWVPNQDAVDVLEKCVDEREKSGLSFDLEAAIRALVNEALVRGSVDDITVLVIDLRVFHALLDSRRKQHSGLMSLHGVQA